MKQQYKEKSVADLADIFRNQKTDKRVLRLLKKELEQRNTKTAAILLKRVTKQIIELNESEKAQRKANNKNKSEKSDSTNIVECKCCSTRLLVPLKQGIQRYSCPTCEINFTVDYCNGRMEATFGKPSLDRRILCVDFGTSSIRAAMRSSDSAEAQVIELGESFNSSIDSASIPSAIFITDNKSTIYFGEEALSKGLKREKSSLFEISPKKWMTLEHPEKLDEEVLPGFKITRKQLLAGLLAQAFSSIQLATGITEYRLLNLNTRISHPVWEPSKNKQLQEFLIWIATAAKKIAGQTNTGISPKKLLNSFTGSVSINRQLLVNVQEPVAAALHLYRNTKNSRQICVLIDIGAGTTDLAAFISVTPDTAWHNRKFIQIGEARSIFKAGDLIDEEVIKLILKKAKVLAKEEILHLSLRRRQIKETLFSRTGSIFEAGVEVTIEDLKQQVRIKEMCQEIKEAFTQMLVEASYSFLHYLTAPIHRISSIDVVFAGGGAQVPFLKEAIGTSIRLLEKYEIPLLIHQAIAPQHGPRASIERLAVALGGTTPKTDWPDTEKKTGYYKGLLR